MALVQGGPEKILLVTIDSFVVNSNFCGPPCYGQHRQKCFWKKRKLAAKWDTKLCI